MKCNLLSKSPLIILTLFLLVLGIIYFLIIIFEYKFFPISNLMLNFASLGFIIWLTVQSFNKKDEKTKTTALCSIFLPLITIIFFTEKGFTTSFTNFNIALYSIHSVITYICSLVIFFSYRQRKGVKIGLGITYSVLLIPVSIIFFSIMFFSIIFADFSKDETVKSEMSPNSIYLAEIINNDQGALGGNSYVTVTRQNRNFNLLIGKIKKKPKIICSGRIWEFDEMALKWDTDEIIYIGEIKYEITK